MDDPDFLKHLIGGLPVEDVKRAYEEYQERSTGFAPYELWVQTLGSRSEMEDVLKQLWYYDQHAKAASEIWVLDMKVSKRMPRDAAKRRTDPITTDEILQFFSRLAKNGLVRSTKKSQK